jgi:hypothetical protein
MKDFVNRPIPQLLRYELFLKGIMGVTAAEHVDIDTTSHRHQKGAWKGTVASAKQQELWGTMILSQC